MATTNLERWMHVMEKCESSVHVLEWAFYGAISAALERRVCYKEWPTLAGPTSLFTNLYVIIVGPPAAGKSMPVSWIKELFKSHGGFDSKEDFMKQLVHIAPNSVSVQALWTRMAVKNALFRVPYKTYPEAFPPIALKEDGVPKIDPFIYLTTPVAVIADQELGSFLPGYATETVNFLQEAYVASDFEDLKISSGSRFLKKCCMTMVGCTNPEWILEAQRNKLLSQGLASRTIFVWVDRKRFRNSHFTLSPEARQSFKEIATHIKSLSCLFGKAVPSQEAAEWFDNWYMSGGDRPINKSEKLVDYYGRKRVHLIKLAMVLHFAESLDMTIQLSDFKRALDLLNRTEPTMHRALGGSGINPAYDVANLILENLSATNGVGMPSVQLLARVFAHCPQGRQTFEDALEFLNVTEQIEPSTDHLGRPTYKRKEI